jgi:hypothetical protein
VSLTLAMGKRCEIGKNVTRVTAVTWCAVILRPSPPDDE